MTLKRLIKTFKALGGKQAKETVKSLREIRAAYILQQDQAIRDSRDIDTVRFVGVVVGR